MTTLEKFRNSTKSKRAILVAVAVVLPGLWGGIWIWRYSIIAEFSLKEPAVSEKEQLLISLKAANLVGGGMTAYQLSEQEENYFARKRFLLRSYFLFDHLSRDHPEFRDESVDRMQYEGRKRLFSRKEWLGF